MFGSHGWQQILSTVDISQSFFNVEVRKCDRDKTAFVTRQGQFRFRRLPQGLSNSPSIFSRLMSLVLRGLTYLCCLAFIDDVVVIGATFDEHLCNLEMVLRRFKYANLK